MLNHSSNFSGYQGGRSHQDEKANGLLNDGIAAVMAGEISLARRSLEQAGGLNPGDSRIWLWLSATSEDPAQQRLYLERALAADPNNNAALRGLKMLSEGVPGGWPADRAEPSGEKVRVQYFQCSQCGGHLHFDVRQQEVTCQFCGYVHQTGKLLVADAAEQALGTALPTRRGHRWAEEHQNLACEKCGAVSLIPPGVTSDRCPYCASNRMVTAPEADDLVEPLSLALLKVDEEKAYARLRTWLSKGGLTPAGLARHAERIELHSTYFPFWTFDGILALSWRAEINEGTSKHPHWVPVNGVETEVFDDILIPGLKAQALNEVKQIEPFNLKDLVAFESHYLAGWPALMYDTPLSKASLQAREIVMRRLRPMLGGRVSNGKQMRNLSSGTPNWQEMTFKLVLLPLWVGVYTYQGKQYRLWINGQTGKVGGSRPRNYFKLLGVALAAMLIAAMTILLLAAGILLLGS